MLKYVSVVSFILWGYFNFFMIQFKGSVEPVNIIFVTFITSLIISFSYTIISNNSIKHIQIEKKTKILSFFSGIVQSLLYLSYFGFIFMFQSDTLLIIVFYYLYGIILIIMDVIIFKTKIILKEYIILFAISILSIYLIISTQLSLGKEINEFSYYSLLGFIPGFLAALIGVMYKSSNGYKVNNLKELININIKLMFYRSIGALSLVIVYIIVIDKEIDINRLEIIIGILYGIFNYIIAHSLYTISLYKKIPMLLVSLFVNISPIITLIMVFNYTDIPNTISFKSLIIIIIIFILSTFLGIYHRNKNKINV